MILDAIKERGEVVTKIAYADWTRAGEYSRHLTQHAIRLVQRNLTPGGDKNGADINLALDALEMAFTHPHINSYVIVGGDSDFLSLVEKLKQYDKKVFVVGGRAFTSVILQRNCHEFIAYENLGGRRSVSRGGRPPASHANAPIAQAVPIVRRALKILSDREVSPQTGLLKSTLLQLDSTFSERNYGASSFLDFAEKLAQAGVVTLKHAGRGVMVELNEGSRDEGESGLTARGAAPEGEIQGLQGRQVEPGHETAAVPPTDAARQLEPAPQQSAQSLAEGVARAGRILASARNARWPMYLRNVKQILRQHRGDGVSGLAEQGGFDERRYGFGGLMDLMRALQRDGFIRLERDRRGGIRVFAGANLQKAALPEVPAEEALVADAQPVEPPAGFAPFESTDSGEPEAEPVPRDTTAELLGRAKPKRTRTRAPGSGSAPRKTSASPKKPGARRTVRARRASIDSADKQGEG
jgi:hypothetical protein